MKTLLMFVALALAFPIGAYAQDDQGEKLTENAWKYPSSVLARPTGPPKCHVYGDDLICDKPLYAPVPQVTYTKPSNCGWNRKTDRPYCW